MRSHGYRSSVLAGLLCALWLSASPLPAQTPDCTGVPQWNPGTIYNPGNRVVYQGRLYEAAVQIWNTPPTHCPSCGYYRDLGACGGGGGGGNVPPTVGLTAPANGATFSAGSNITLMATAQDGDGTIARVEFFQGATSLGADTTAPYSVTWTSVPAALYSLTARATDNAGATTTSAARSITVTGGGGGGSCNNAPQYVAGTSYAQGREVQNQGQLFRCNVAGWCSSSAAWAYAPGTGMHWQDAWSLLGSCGGGGAPPSVALTAPAAGASFACNTSIAVSASASDSDGTVTRVEFFDGGLKIGEDASSPYSVAWSTPVTGQHSLTAKATDNASNPTTSAARTVNITGNCSGGLPRRLLVGYWHNFENGSGFIKLRDVPAEWDIVNVAFGEPVSPSNPTIVLTPHGGTSEAEIKSDVQILKGRGKKVLLSIGGANGHVELSDATRRNSFLSSVGGIVASYGFDGIDVDFEGQSLSLNAGDSDFRSPTTPVIVNLISALRSLRTRFGGGFILTMAPETFFVQVGHQFYGGATGGDRRTGAYLPVIHGVRDILTLLHVQDYNSGPVTALDGRFYSMGNADFHVAMTEMLLTGFTVANTGQSFPGLRPDQVAIGLPANGNAANGFTPAAEVQRALDYLIRGRSFGGQYVLRRPGGYPGLRGLMAWSINWDRFAGFTFSRPHRAYLNALP